MRNWIECQVSTGYERLASRKLAHKTGKSGLLVTTVVLTALALVTAQAHAQPITPQLQVTGAGSYSGTTGEFQLQAQPTSITLADGTSVPFDAAPAPALSVSILLDHTLQFITGLEPGPLLIGGNPAKTDFVLSGSVHIQNDTYSGVLLAGEIAGTPGALALAATPDRFFMTFVITSGTMADLFGGPGSVIIVSATVPWIAGVPNKQFTSDFTVNAAGSSSITVAGSSSCSGVISVGLFSDTNNNRQQDLGEGVASAWVTVFDSSGQHVVASSLVDTQAQFAGLCQGRYIVRADGSAQENSAPALCRPPFCGPLRASAIPVAVPASSAPDPFASAAPTVIGNPDGTVVELRSPTDQAGILFPIFLDPDRASISGGAWLDTNRNGIRDPGESATDPGFVTLYRGNTFYSLHRNNLSVYAFSNLPDGTYLVCVSRALTSDIRYPLTPGCAGPFVLTRGQHLQNVDFGFAAGGPLQVFNRTVFVEATTANPLELIPVPIRFGYQAIVGQVLRETLAGTLPTAFYVRPTIGEEVIVEAPPEITIGGTAYRFIKWDSPGGPSTNTRLAVRPNGDGTLSARYAPRPGAALRFRAQTLSGGALQVPLAVTQPSPGTQLTPWQPSFAFGTPLTVKAPPIIPGAAFMFWRNAASGTVLTYQTTINGTINGDLDLIAVYRSTP